MRFKTSITLKKAMYWRQNSHKKLPSSQRGKILIKTLSHGQFLVGQTWSLLLLVFHNTLGSSILISPPFNPHNRQSLACISFVAIQPLSGKQKILFEPAPGAGKNVAFSILRTQPQTKSNFILYTQEFSLLVVLCPVILNVFLNLHNA